MGAMDAWGTVGGVVCSVGEWVFFLVDAGASLASVPVLYIQQF